MIELVILNHLTEKLDDVPVLLEHEDTDPETFVIFEKTGGTKSNHLSASTWAFQSYAPTLYEAAYLNVRLKAAVESLIELDEIGSVRLNSDYNYTDTETKRYRYQAVYDINHY